MSHQQQQEKMKRALIVGGSIAGLLSARIIADFFEEVIIVERDCLDQGMNPRTGVPQSTQPHVLLTQGYRILKELFPSIEYDLLEAGAIPIDWGQDFRYFIFDGWNAVHDKPTDLKSFSCTRPLLEGVIRHHVGQLANVRILSPYRVEGLIGKPTAVSGVRCTKVGDKNESHLIQADLTIDASGRSSNAQKWLSQLQVSLPSVDVVDAGLGYATRRYRIRSWDYPWKIMVLNHEPPSNRRLGYIARIEDDEFIATLGGYCKDYPPTAHDEFIKYAKELIHPAFYDVIAHAEPASEIKAHRATANRLYRYDKLKCMPQGFVALGDSVCALCPPYGQGLTVSAISALALGDWVENRAVGSDSLVFQKSLYKQIKPSWQLATTFDTGFENSEGKYSRSLFDKLSMRYLQTLITKAQKDSHLSVRLARITHMIDSPLNFFHPRILMKL